MANQPIRIKSHKDLHKYKHLIKENSDKTIENIKTLVSTEDSITALHEFKFNKLGYEPIQGYRLNFIEQLNQMFSHIVVLKGAEFLLKNYPGKEFILNMGTQGGFDIVSVDKKIICECFSTTSPISNNKIKLDAEKLLKNNTAERKYIIFFSKEVNLTTLNNIINKYNEITFIRLDSIDI
jgi:hypothetical protein